MESTSRTHPVSSRARGPGGVAHRSVVGADRTEPTAAIAVRKLAKGYAAGVAGCSARVEALRDADLDVIAGEAIGILGARGAGKSTLLLCLGGLLRPDAGTIAWFGRPADAAGRPPGIAYVPERAAHYAFMTVREAVEYHSLLRDACAADRTDDVIRALEQAGLAAIATARVGDLPWSIGPRLSLAQALVAQPRVLLLDETLSGLDPRARREVSIMLQGLVRCGTTVVVAADTLDTLDGVASRVAVMIDGRLTAPVAVAALDRPRVLELVVATPALARRIFGARVAEESWDRHVLRLPLDGTTPEAILARCTASGIRVEASRITLREPGDSH